MSGSTFWSRRQAAVAEEARAEQEAVHAAELAQTEAALEERSDEELLTECGLPQPEALDSPEQVREFLNSALPQRLKTRALRRLWRLNPVLANLDGLLDYGEDYTDAANVIENMQTAYQVGKGMLSHIEALAAEAEAKAAEQDAPSEPVEETEEQEDEMILAEVDPDQSIHMPDEIYPEDLDITPEPATRRRMTFQFKTTA